MRQLVVCTGIVAVTCAAIAASGFELYSSLFAVTLAILSIVFLLTQSPLLVSSLGCVLSLPLVVTGYEHVRGPIGILLWYSFRAGLGGHATIIAAAATASGIAVLLSLAVRKLWVRVTLCSFAVIGMFSLWLYLTVDSMFLGWAYLASAPLLACLSWRVLLEVAYIRGRDRPT